MFTVPMCSNGRIVSLLADFSSKPTGTLARPLKASLPAQAGSTILSAFFYMAFLFFAFLGPATGVPFHFHGPGFGEVIYGRKRWFLYAPDKEPKFDPDKSTLQWYREAYPNLERENMPLECTIGPHEVIYFPDRWWHSTLNIDTSVFMSTFLGPP